MGGRKNHRRFPQIAGQFKAMGKALVDAGPAGNSQFPVGRLLTQVAVNWEILGHLSRVIHQGQDFPV